MKRNPVGTCPRCGSEGEHPRNYGRPQRDRGWCRECGSLWTIPVHTTAELTMAHRVKLRLELRLECPVCRQLRQTGMTQEQILAMVEVADPRTTCPACGQDVPHWQNRIYQQRATIYRLKR